MSASRKKAVEPLATRWISKKQVARLLDISVSTVERNVKRGILPDPTYKLGSRAPRWNEDDINILMELDG
jgi:predicted DNA-binding transcriptional regulator AlpA